MIRHIVLTRFKPGTRDAEIGEIYGGLKRLVDQLPGASNFVGGHSESPEQIERGYLHGFTIDFESWDALEVYAGNTEHQALGALLVANAIDGIDGLLVLDIQTE